MTGVALGSCLVGMRPIMTHMRLEFAMTAMDQICNQAAKWHYMFGGQSKVPLTIRMLIGRGWGQGPQHSQSLHAWFAHVPGLKVVMPSTPYDAKGLLIASIEDDNPVDLLRAPLAAQHPWARAGGPLHGPDRRAAHRHRRRRRDDRRRFLRHDRGDQGRARARAGRHQGRGHRLAHHRAPQRRGDPRVRAQDRPARGGGPGNADRRICRRDRRAGDRSRPSTRSGRRRSA